MKNAMAVTAAVLTALTCSHASAQEVEMSDGLALLLTTAIQSERYDCPVVKMAWQKGMSAQGANLKVWCGPEDREGLFQHAIYRVVIRSDKSLAVIPWVD